MNYPIDLSFKVFALASQIYMRDANGNMLGYVKQKMLKLKEDINIFTDEDQTQLMFNIKADRILDFSAKYNFTNRAGAHIGAIKRQGRRSIWKASYEITDAQDRLVFQVNEENGWIKVADALAREVPVLGMFTGYFFNPAYVIKRENGAPVARLAKQPAFLEGKFRIERNANLTPDEENLVLLGVLMITLLERSRG